MHNIEKEGTLRWGLNYMHPDFFWLGYKIPCQHNIVSLENNAI